MAENISPEPRAEIPRLSEDPKVHPLQIAAWIATIALAVVTAVGLTLRLFGF